MKILHIGLTNCFTEGLLYQDNILTDINCEEGHDVTYISSTEKYVNGVLERVPEQDEILPNGLRVIRLDYDYIISPFITKKIHKCRKVKKYLEEIQPDVILYHNCTGYALVDVADYVKANPNVLLYLDTHQDFSNSSRNIISRFVNKYIHGRYVKKVYPYVKKFLSITLESSYYLEKLYKIPEDMIEDFPLGGIMMSNEEQARCRNNILDEFGYGNNTIVLGHSGKLTRDKKTIELLQALKKLNDDRFKLIIFGYIPEGDKELKEIIDNDSKVKFVGWKNATEQHELLGAIDLYCQPGAQSATVEMAACDGCALMVSKRPSYEYMYEDSAWYVDTENDILEVLRKISEDKSLLETMRQKATIMAEKKLDYRVLANRYLH